MFSKNSARLLLTALCAAFLVVLGVSFFKHREDPATPRNESLPLMHAQPAHLPANPATTPTPTSDANARENFPSVDESAPSPAIPAFRQWAETAAAAGFAAADLTQGMQLAKARAAAIKTLIQQDPASALRQALPADLRASLPPKIAAAIEQPVQTSGMVSIRMMCHHSPDTPHGNCESTPVLLEDVADWNAYYGTQQWRSLVGQEVEFEGVAVEGELAVRSITPHSNKKKRRDF